MRICLAFLFLLAASPAMAEGSSRGYGGGGWFKTFDPVVAEYNRTGERFRIVGHCQSACTMFLGIRNVCIEPSARLLFHAGHNYQRQITAYATNKILSHYNARLRHYLVSNGYMNTLDFHAISGRDLIEKFGYRACPRR